MIYESSRESSRALNESDPGKSVQERGREEGTRWMEGKRGRISEFETLATPHEQRLICPRKQTQINIAYALFCGNTFLLCGPRIFLSCQTTGNDGAFVLRE